jgi:hypothetical protein
MLPETVSLWPVFQLLIRFPGLQSNGRAAIASTIFRLLIADRDKRTLIELCRDVNRAMTGGEALATLGKKLGDAEDNIRIGLDKADSLTNRFVLMLYWLLHRRGASDFSYDINLPDRASLLRGRYGTSSEAPLSEAAEAQKQHVVPYKLLKRMFALEGARPGRHRAHDIGHITYISAMLNSYETGVGSQMLNMGEEPPTNREAHLLNDARVLKACESLRQISERSPLDIERAKHTFDELCGIRRKAIHAALVEWDNELARLAARDHAVLSQVLHERRLVNETREDFLARYPPELAKRLAGFMQRGFKPSPLTDGTFAISYRRPGKGKKQMLRIDCSEGAEHLKLKLADGPLADLFARQFSNVEMSVKKGSHRYSLNTTTPSEVSAACDVLDWIAQHLR